MVEANFLRSRTLYRIYSSPLADLGNINIARHRAKLTRILIVELSIFVDFWRFGRTY